MGRSCDQYISCNGPSGQTSAAPKGLGSFKFSSSFRLFRSHVDARQTTRVPQAEEPRFLPAGGLRPERRPPLARR